MPYSRYRKSLEKDDNKNYILDGVTLPVSA